VIMAAGTAVRIMEDFGLAPHFMVGIDAGAKEGEIHSNVKTKIYILLFKPGFNIFCGWLQRPQICYELSY